MCLSLVIAEFEAGMTSSKDTIPKHHDQSPSVQNRFVADTKALVAAFQEMGNPFNEGKEAAFSVCEGTTGVPSSPLQ